MESVIIKNIGALEDAVEQILDIIGDSRIVAFYGAMGAGKTTVISEICRQLGVCEKVCSPSFSIVNVYNTEDDQEIYHFDFYRIEKLEEAFDFGYQEYFYSGNLCLIEWPEKVEEILPEDVLRVEIVAVDENTRIVKFR